MTLYFYRGCQYDSHEDAVECGGIRTFVDIKNMKMLHEQLSIIETIADCYEGGWDTAARFSLGICYRKDTTKMESVIIKGQSQILFQDMDLKQLYDLVNRLDEGGKIVFKQRKSNNV